MPSATLVKPCRSKVGTIEGVARWQRHARWVLALVAVAVIASVAYTMRPREIAAPPPRTEALPPGIATKTEGGEAIRYKAGDRDITVAFKSQTPATKGRQAPRR